MELVKANSLSVHGIVRLLDKMMSSLALTPVQTASALRRILDQGARLPAGVAEKMNERITPVQNPAVSGCTQHEARKDDLIA